MPSWHFTRAHATLVTRQLNHTWTVGPIHLILSFSDTFSESFINKFSQVKVEKTSMAVESHNLNPLFSSNREMILPAETNGLVYNTNFRYDTVPTTTFNPTVGFQNPVYNISPIDFCTHQPMKQTIHSVDSSVTFNSDNHTNNNNVDFTRPMSSSRKRNREESFVVNMHNQKNSSDPLIFLGQGLSFNVQNHNYDIDQLISNHVEIMRMEIEEKRKTQGRKIMESIEQKLIKTLRAKDEEINHIAKLNLYLEEKVKSLCVENQIWRDVAQSNEANVNALRSNLQQVLSAVERNRCEEPTVAAEDAVSCCGSNDVGDSEERWKLAGEAHDSKKMRRIASVCRSCGEGEASVLLLPCRHMCLCSKCGSTVNTCPVCKSSKNASLHVNLSS
ncbi:unnamed protein product [Cochlearia groenlandica]